MQYKKMFNYRLFVVPMIVGSIALGFSKLTFAGSVSYGFESANYWGNESQIIRNFTDAQQCARLCDLNQNCRVASFHGPNATGGWAYTCVLRNAVGPRHTEQQDIWSWVK